MTQLIESIEIEDDVTAHAERAIEVKVTLKSGEVRWCFFVSQEGVSQFGDFLNSDSSVRLHFGASHMIVVSKISEEIIKETLHHIDSTGEVERSTLPLIP